MTRKFSFNHAKAFVLSLFGSKGISEELGKTLAKEQKDVIVEAYGEAFAEKFESALGADKPEAFANDLRDAMKAMFEPEAAEATKEVADKLRESIAENKRLKDLNAALMAEDETPPPAETTEFQGKAGIPKVLSVARKSAHYAAVFAALAVGSMSAASGATIDVTDLRQEFGTYLSQNQSKQDIIKQLFNGFTSAKYFKSVPAVTEYRAIQAQINSVVQQFTAKWTPKGNTKFTPLTIKNRRHKINVPIIPAEVLDSYLFYLYDESMSPEQMPITKYIWNELLYPQILDDIELRMIFKGKFEEVADSDLPTDPEQGMDGIEEILVQQKALGATSKVNFFNDLSINWITATDEQVIKFFEAFVDKLKPLYKNKKMNLYVAPEVLTRYERAYKKLWGANSGQDGDFGTKRIDFSNVTIVALDGMTGSPIIFSTPDGNMVKLRHKNDPPFVVNKVLETHYSVDIVGEFWLAVGFQIAEAVFAYVPNGYDPQASLVPSNQFPDGTSPDAGSTGSEDDGLG